MKPNSIKHNEAGVFLAVSGFTAAVVLRPSMHTWPCARRHTMRGAEDTWLSLETEYVMNRLLYVMNCDVLTIYRVFCGSSTKKNQAFDIFYYSSAGNYQFFGLCCVRMFDFKIGV